MNHDYGPSAGITSPYRGVEPYRFADRAIFFARDGETRTLLRSVTIYRGVLLYGNSGAGKSSLINAGLVPAVTAEQFVADRVRVQPHPGEEFIVERSDGMRLANGDWPTSTFLSRTRKEPRAFSAAQFRRRLTRAAPGCCPLLIFDQFEELITLFEEAPRGRALKTSLAAQETIRRAIVDLLRDPRLPVKLLFAFREDYLAKLNQLFVLLPDLRDQYVRLTAPRKDLLRAIIRGPFERRELRGAFGRELSPKLVDTLVPMILERTEGDAINLTEVQIVCSQLWRSRRPTALLKKGGIQGLLENYTTNAIDKLAAEHLKGPAIALLARLVTPSGTRNVVSKEDLIERVYEEEGLKRENLERALVALETKTKLIVREQRHGSSFYEIVSEFLVPWIVQQKVERSGLNWRRAGTLPLGEHEGTSQDDRQIAMLRRGVRKWNLWRDLNPTIHPTLGGVDLSKMKLGGVNLSRAAMANAKLSGASLRSARLSGADLTHADLAGTDLLSADLSGATMIGANLTAARLNGANLNDVKLSMSLLRNAAARHAEFQRADLGRADIGGADLRGADLSYANLSGANLSKANLEDCRVYGIAAWDLSLDDARQSNLIVTRPDDTTLTVDSLEVAQYFYMLLNSDKVRDLLNATTSKVVLVLGNYAAARKAVLEVIREKLRQRGYVPILFDFEKPSSRDVTKTLLSLAHMSRFIIADVTEARSIPHELAVIVPALPSVPIQPLLVGPGQPFAMLADLAHYPWVMPIAHFQSGEALARSFTRLIEPAERGVRPRT